MSQPSPLDVELMRRCIVVSQKAADAGENPFGALVSRGGKILVEAPNRAERDRDVTRHAELLALAQAQKVLGSKDLSSCTLVTSVEPCVMCSFPIRETRISKI